MLTESIGRAQLSAVQTRSTSFRGFTEEELDMLFPFLSMIEVWSGERRQRDGCCILLVPSCLRRTNLAVVRASIRSFGRAIRS